MTLLTVLYGTDNSPFIVNKSHGLNADIIHINPLMFGVIYDKTEEYKHETAGRGFIHQP